MDKFEFHKKILILLFFVSAYLIHPQTKKEPNSYNHLFVIRNIRGWTVYVNKQNLLDHPGEMDTALDYLHSKLYQVFLDVTSLKSAALNQKKELFIDLIQNLHNFPKFFDNFPPIISLI